MALAAEHEPDLVVLDVRMPRLGGIEAARRIVSDRPVPARDAVGLRPAGARAGRRRRRLVRLRGQAVPRRGPVRGDHHGPRALPRAGLRPRRGRRARRGARRASGGAPGPGRPDEGRRGRRARRPGPAPACGCRSAGPSPPSPRPSSPCWAMAEVRRPAPADVQRRRPPGPAARGHRRGRRPVTTREFAHALSDATPGPGAVGSDDRPALRLLAGSARGGRRRAGPGPLAAPGDAGAASPAGGRPAAGGRAGRLLEPGGLPRPPAAPSHGADPGRDRARVPLLAGGRGRRQGLPAPTRGPNLSDELLLGTLAAAAHALGRATLGTSEYDAYRAARSADRLPSVVAIARRFGSWDAALVRAGLLPTPGQARPRTTLAGSAACACSPPSGRRSP